MSCASVSRESTIRAAAVRISGTRRLPAPLLAACSAVLLLGCASPPHTTALAVQPLLRMQHSGDQGAAAWYRLGKYHQERGQIGLAMGAYAQSLALDGRQLDARMAVAAIDARQGRLAEARDALLALVDDYPAQAQLSNNLGYVYHLMGDQQAAIAMLRRALALDAASTRAQDNLRLAEAAAAAGAASAQLAAAPAPAPISTAISPSAGAAGTAVQAVPAVSAGAAPPMPAATATAPAVPATRLPLPAAAEAVDAGLPPPTRAELREVQEQLRQLQLRHAATEAAAAAATKIASDAAATVAATATSLAVAPLPATASSAPAPLPAVPAPSAALLAQLEIANGNGVPGLAKRFRRALAQLGIPVERLSNEKPYRQQQTTIEYRPGYRQQAAELQAALRGQATLQDAGPRTRTELRLVLGKDAPAQLASAENAATLLAALGTGISTNTSSND
jgi:tetratricopeptide (TPR) repeat protein